MDMMSLGPTLLMIVATSILATNVAVNFLRYARPGLSGGQTLVSAYLIALIFCLLWGSYSGDLTRTALADPLQAFSGYLLAAWFVLIGSTLAHEVMKLAERKQDPS
jgi:hypothetical protein